MQNRLRSLLIALTLLALPAPSGAFVSIFTIVGYDETFTFAVGINPQWTLTRAPNPRQYRGATADSAKFSGESGLSFGDKTEILLDGLPIDAVVKVKVSPDCSKVRVTLKDLTNRRTITLVYPNPDDPASYISCEPL
jgi:hypothetical protein